MGALGDYENIILSTLQQPGANFGVGLYPVWANLNNPQYGQGEVDYYINEGYRRVCTDLRDTRLATASCTFSSIAGVASYPFPPTGATVYPQLGKVLDVQYLPVGLTSTVRAEPGFTLLSWEQFNRETGQGYLRANSAGVYPRVVAVGPQFNTLEFYPNPLQTGDTITVIYSAIPTPLAVQIPTLVQQTDMSILPQDADLAIVYWAISMLAPKMNDAEMQKMYRQMYQEEIDRVKDRFAMLSSGDAMVLENQPSSGMLGYPWVL